MANNSRAVCTDNNRNSFLRIGHHERFKRRIVHLRQETHRTGIKTERPQLREISGKIEPSRTQFTQAVGYHLSRKFKRGTMGDLRLQLDSACDRRGDFMRSRLDVDHRRALERGKGKLPAGKAVTVSIKTDCTHLCIACDSHLRCRCVPRSKHGAFTAARNSSAPG